MEPSVTSILIIDDEQLIVDQLSLFLGKFGYNITGLSDSEEALKYIKENDYDIVLTDLKMPVVSGMDIIKAVKEKNSETELVIMTAFATVDSAIEALQYGVYDYIQKPFKFKEIQVIISRAAEKVYLKRENIALNKKIQQMLSYITMLYDISSILYQIPDFNVVSDMILDTLTEGMKVKKAALFLYDESSGVFKIIKQRGLSNSFVNRFKFQNESTINNINISLIETTNVLNLKNGIKINGTNLKGDDVLNRCVLFPIRYLEKLLGYIGIFQIQGNIFSKEDEIKLLNILATQIAPLFQTSRQYEDKLFISSESYEKFFYNIVNERIISAKKEQSSVAFGLLRLTNMGLGNFSSLKELKSSCKKIIKDEFNSIAEIIWQSFDSILIIITGENPVAIELSCANVRAKIEDLYTKNEGTPMLSLRYAIMTYPLDENSADGIIKGLEYKFFNKMEKVPSINTK
ncbi:MAG: hypothetical protein DRP89_08665 [Candidatus Neomarinimicrobiota bacterium]|nr:MAG: hypothetical protein DRP89_08665 [Candidatus Neomarinimicrobiota bacterium]